MTPSFEIERFTFRQVALLRRDQLSAKAKQAWDVLDPNGVTVAQAEVFEGQEQWGVRLFDKLPQLDPSDLVRVVARMLVWHANCPSETVELRIQRPGVQSQILVRVSGDYV
jgi:hypothetical protein